MSSEIDALAEEPHFTLTREQADELVSGALDTDLNEPESLIRMLLLLFDNAKDPQMEDAIFLLMKVAFDGSIVHSINFQEYLEAIRQGRSPLEEARSRSRTEHN